MKEKGADQSNDLNYPPVSCFECLFLCSLNFNKPFAADSVSWLTRRFHMPEGASGMAKTLSQVPPNHATDQSQDPVLPGNMHASFIGGSVDGAGKSIFINLIVYWKIKEKLGLQ